MSTYSNQHNLPRISPDKVKRAYSRRFHNIYLFVTERCQLRCGHCYMGDRLERGLIMPYEKATNTISYFHRLGAEYLTFVGGEPTLHPDSSKDVDYALESGYQKVMLDSNGLLFNRIIKTIQPEKLYYLRISLDGATAETHDKVRGKGSYEKTIHAIKKLVEAGYHVRITSTVFQFNLHEVEQMLALSDKLGVELLNFHTFSEEGYGAENARWSLTPDDWIKFYEKLEIVKANYQIKVRYPPTWVNNERLGKYVSAGFQGCLGCSLDRLSVFPDGRCYVCSLLFDESAHFATLTDKGLILNKSSHNEYEMFISSLSDAAEPWLTGCPAEEFLEKNGKQTKPSNLVSVCRLWKHEI